MTSALDPSAALCTCGIRGCDLAALHAAAFVTREPIRRRVRKRHKRGR